MVCATAVAGSRTKAKATNRFMKSPSVGACLARLRPERDKETCRHREELPRAAIPLAFVSPWLANGLYVSVALIWLVPDRLIERVVAKRSE